MNDRGTLEKLAVNAVMAGCEPACFPIVLAAVEAMLDPAFNLYGVQATTHPVAPLLIVSGPYGRRVGVHGGSGCFGPGFRANATIGRAVRLILLNVGGAWPGRHDMATQGSPAKFSYCIAENVEASPWEPLHGGDVVTVYGGEPPHNVNDHVSTTAAGILTTIADTAVSLGSNVGWYFAQGQLLVVLGPEHARTIAGDGLGRRDVQQFVFETARQPLGHMKLGGMWGMHDWPAWLNPATAIFVAAVTMSPSGSMMTGALLPSSRPTFLRAAFALIPHPTSGDPVNVIIAMSSCSTIVLPTEPPLPVTTLR